MSSNDCDNFDVCKDHTLRVKFYSGSSVVKIRPLFTFDSKCIIVASGTNVKVFSIASGECIQSLQKHKTQVISLQLNKNNHLQIFSCSKDGIVIRWDFAEGQALEVYNSKFSPVTSFYAPSANENCFVTAKNSSTGEYQLHLFSLNRKEYRRKIFHDVLQHDNAVGFGVECKFAVAVMNNKLQVFDFHKDTFRRHMVGEQHILLCVACHPTELVVATGDNMGRVLIWANFLHSNYPTRSIYHWHSLPLADIVFSSEGTYLFSGGGEAALLKWTVNTENRHILPRMGLPILRLAVSSHNDYVVTAHEDNALQIVNSVSKVVQIIQGLTQCHFRSSSNKNTLSTGILYDSRSESLVMNGRPGHLQFYKIHEDKQLFNLDIVGRNIVCQEKDMVIVNSDVQKAALDDKGEWLATVEYWCADEISPEIRLKFWNFDVVKQTFVLNTDVFLPHNKEVNYVGFKPFHEGLDLPLAVTTSNDGKFKLWSLNSENSSYKKESWSCESMGYYRDLPAGDGCFSDDGSLLAVAFGPVATLWIPLSMVLKARFCLATSNSSIQQLMFGSCSCSHLLVCNSGSNIVIWNVLTSSAQLIINYAVQLLVSNRKSDIMAAFSVKNRNLIVFKPSNPQPIWFKKYASDKPVIAAIFVPSSNLSKENHSQLNCWHKKFQLFFFNEDQNLLTVTDEVDTDSTLNLPKLKVEQHIPPTPFGMLQAEHSKSNVKTDFTKQHIINVQTDNSKIFSVTCPTNQNPIAMCRAILPTLLIPAKKKDTDETLTNEDMNIDSNVDEPMDIDKNSKTAKDSKFLADFVGVTDFSFLRDTVSFTRR